MSVVIFPSVNSWITPRTTVGKIEDNNCLLMLPQKIESIHRILLNATNISALKHYCESAGCIATN